MNDGLKHACEGEHKELVLLMLEKGAHINNFLVKLDFEDVYYLLLRGHKEFGRFNNIANECKKHLLEFQNVAEEFFIKDVANVIMKY